MSPHAAPPQAFRFAQLSSGARIAWTRTGPPTAPTLVRVAHWLTNVEYDLRSPLWRPWVERLSRSFGLVRYDERGCGMSGDDPRPRGLEPWVEELEAVVDAAVDASREPKVALLGVSGGAAIAIAYAMRHPERVSHVVLLGGYLHGALHRGSTPQDRAFLDAQWRLVELGWGRDDPAVREFFSSRFVPAASPEVRDGINEQQRRSCDGPRAADIMRARAGLDVRALAPHFQARLHALRDIPLVVDTRGIGLLGCVECTVRGVERNGMTPLEHLAFDADLGARIDRHCQALGLMLRPIVNQCVFSPALIITHEQIDQMFDIMREGIVRTLHDIERDLGYRVEPLKVAA
jgi:pimeloyl-ACP methyl ester carboxylesterase